jgi:quercetin dioxygenase-like cupin family protein
LYVLEVFVRAKRLFFVVMVSACFGGIRAGAQEPAVLPLEAEPHHHLALKNEYVKVYQVEVAPHDAVKLHRHDTDAISLSLSESLVTIHFPGKTDVEQKIAHGQIRLQALGYVHSTAVDGDTPFRNDTVELLAPQTGKQNRCAQVIASQPLNCSGAEKGGTSLGEPQFETDQTYVGLIRVTPHARVVIGEPGRPILIVALDGGATHARDGGDSSLGAGDFVWLDRGKAAEEFRNASGKEVRFVTFSFKPSDGPSSSGR